ncbi:MAG: hypothetical protein KF865_03805 [Bdellovibrionaceae bacterium]|nr:hypothetical protein [Pseudobdellovibrionaceae bacterium]
MRIRLPIALLLAGAALLGGCKSKPVSPAHQLSQAAKGPAKNLPHDIKLLFLKGSCERGVFSPDGRSALALCTQPEGPALPQLYSVDLGGFSEKRVTWQDGSIGSADWLENDLLVYASTTDELKEIPFLPTKPPPEEIPSDLYISDRVGDSIDRLTKRIGFDGDLSYWPRGKEVLYVSRRGKDDLIQRINGRGKSAIVYHSRGRSVRSPAGLANGQVAWLESSPDGSGVDLRFSGMKEPRLRGRRLLSLRPAPGGQAVIAVESFADGSARVLLVGAPASCERTLAEVPLDLRAADGSLNPPRLLLSVTTGTQGVFALKELPGEGFSCPPPAASVK